MNNRRVLIPEGTVDWKLEDLIRGRARFSVSYCKAFDVRCMCTLSSIASWTLAVDIKNVTAQ